MQTTVLYIAAALAEIAGCYAFWAWLRLDRSPLWLVPGIMSLVLFAVLLALVESAAAAREPHRIAFYLQDLAAAFHAFWNLGNDRPEMRILVEDDAEITSARLFLAERIGQVVRNGLAILGVEAVDEL